MDVIYVSKKLLGVSSICQTSFDNIRKGLLVLNRIKRFSFMERGAFGRVARYKKSSVI